MTKDCIGDYLKAVGKEDWLTKPENKGLSEPQLRRKLISEEHKAIHDSLNEIKKQSVGKQSEYEEVPLLDTKAIEEITSQYDQKIKNLSQPKNETTTKEPTEVKPSIEENKQPTYEDITKEFNITNREKGDEFWRPSEKSAKDVMDWLGNSEFTLPHEKALIKEYGKIIDPNLKIVLNTEMPMNRGGGAVFRNGKLDRIELNPKVTTLKNSTSNFQQVVLHEITHALTYDKSGNMSKDLVAELSPLYDAAHEYINKNLSSLKEKYNEHKITYGLSGINEFAAEAMSNRDFQKVLSAIPYKNTTKSVWTKFIEGVKQYFSKLLGTKNDTLLNEVVNTITKGISKNETTTKEPAPEIKSSPKNKTNDKEKGGGQTTQENSSEGNTGRTDTDSAGASAGRSDGGTNTGKSGTGDTGGKSGRDDGDGIGITHAQTTDIANQLGFQAYEKDPETVEQWDKEADERIKDGEIGAVIEKLEKGDMPTDVEQRMIAKYVAELKSQVEKNPTNEKLSELKYVIELSDIVGGREVAKSLVARKGTFYADESLSGYLIREMEEEGVSELTEGQKTTARKEFEDISKARKEFDEWRAQKEAELNEREASLAVEEMKKKRGKRTQDLAKQREQIIGDILLKFNNTNPSFLGAAQLGAIAPDILKLAKNLVDTGVAKLSDLTAQIVELLKDKVAIEHTEVNQILAGRHTERKPTKNELTATWNDLREEAKLVERLSALERGEIPVTERKRIERNREITDLRNKIKEHKVTKQVAEDKKVAELKQRLSDLDEGKAPKTKTPAEISAERKDLQKQIKEHEVTRLNEAKTRIKASIDKIQKQLDSGDFSKKENPKVTLDEEGRKLQKRLIDLQKQREIRIEKNRYEKRTRRQKNMDLFSEIINIPRSVMASVDFSAPLNQAAIATTAYPIEAAAAVKQMFKSARSQEEFDRWFYELKDSPRYELYKESGLKISDPHSAFLSAREEQFISGLAEKGTKWGFNKVGLKIDPIGGSNRAYTQYLNKMRVDLFNKFINKFEDDGKTYEKNKVLYEKTARYVNNITGAGSIGKLEEHAGLFNALFFSPRLIASRLNLLKPWYWHSLPKEIRGRYFADMGKYLGVRMAVIGSLVVYKSLLQDDDDPDKITIETDSRSSDFMKIRQGNTRWDMWGGFQPYIRIASQVATGQRKTTTSGEIQDFDSDIPNRGMGKNLLNFGRSKLAPFWSSLWNLAEGENVVGEKYTLKSALFSNFVPLSMQSAWEGKDQHGLYTPLKVLAPSVFGIGVSTYAPREKEVKDEVTYRKKEGKVTVEYKVDLTKEQYKEYEGKARKYMERDLKIMEATKEYKGADDTEKAAIKRNIENAAIRKAEKEIVDKYKRSFTLDPADKEKALKAERLKKIKEKVD